MTKEEYEYLRRRLAEKFNTKHYNMFYPEQREEGYKEGILDAEFVLSVAYREWKEYQEEK